MDYDLQFGDCLELMPAIASESVDLILCDLPYGTTKNKWDSVIPLAPLWGQYERIIKPNGAIALTAQAPFDKVLAASNLNIFRYEWIWEKTLATGHLNAKRMPMKAHENVLIFYKSLPTYNPQKTSGHARKVSTAAHKRNSRATSNYGTHGLTSYDSTDRYPRSVLTFPSDRQKSALHPTQKPVALMRYMIDTYSNPGDLVLDNAMGSGTTGVAALEAGRRFLGMESDATYLQIANERLGALALEAA
jgi:site-specific DNA-methyltransferase (adenine-specific)